MAQHTRSFTLGRLAALSTLLCLPLAATAQAQELYELGFDMVPPKLPEKTIVLTFDDGPDWGADTNEDPNKGYTAQVLDILKAKGVSATFFINRDNWSNVADEEDMQNIVRRIVQEGHELGSHTFHHYSLSDQSAYFTEESLMWHPDTPRDDLTAEQIETELSGVEEIVDKIFGAGKQRMTLFRAPYGEPFQVGATAKNYALATDIVKKHAVHIGWNIDSKDYECTGSEFCAFDNVKTALDGGAYGVILMHSVQAQEVASLPMIIDYLKEGGYAFWSVEQAVCATYGKYSKDLVDGAEGTCDPNDDTTEPQPGDGSSGDGASEDGSPGDGEEDGGTTVVKKEGCSVGFAGSPDACSFAPLALGLLLALRRRRRANSEAA